ncbi:unnamed protein product [Amoebophrya sp. A25]|nr:unnamed protein product [Amoebophrya sp. A25]|eukprot:GSA25T00000462001.1
METTTQEAEKSKDEKEWLLTVRALHPTDGPEARKIWRAAMLGHDLAPPAKEMISHFVQSRIDDENDMGDPYRSFVRPSQGRNFWVVAAARRGDSHAEKVVDHIHTESEVVVGCVGALLRTADDMQRVTPVGKEYLERVEGDNFPLWKHPLGINSAAVELIRMAVRSDFRGHKFSVSGGSHLLRVSELLTDTVARWAREQEAAFVVLTTGRAMQTAVRAYQRLGFHARELPRNVAFSAKTDDMLRLEPKPNK